MPRRRRRDDDLAALAAADQLAARERGTPWERQPGETSLWFARFDRFRVLGHTRTISAVWQQEGGRKGGKPPYRWYREASRWRWVERAEAWDAAQRALEEQERERERRENREQRIKLLRGFFGKVAQAVVNLQPERASWSLTTQALQAVVRELRAEFDDEPVQRTEVSAPPDGEAPFRFTIRLGDRELLGSALDDRDEP